MTEERVWYWIDTGWACGGVVVLKGVVVDCAPIFRRSMMGRPWRPLGKWKVQVMLEETK
jgi:hypothetical protein